MKNSNYLENSLIILGLIILSKLGSTLSQPEGQILIDIINDHGLEQMVHFPTQEKNILDLIFTTLPGQFQDVHSPDKLSDHDIVSGTLKIFIPPIKKPWRKVYLYQKGDYESMRKDTLEFAKEKYFSGHSDTHSVEENFDLLKYVQISWLILMNINSCQIGNMRSGKDTVVKLS